MCARRIQHSRGQLRSSGGNVASIILIAFLCSLSASAQVPLTPLHLPGAPPLTDGRHLGIEGEKAPRSEAPAIGPARHRPLPPSATSDSRIVAGPPGSRDLRFDLSAAHFLVRAFSVDSPFFAADTALAQALADDRSLTSSGLAAALARYDAELPDVDAFRADSSRLGEAKVKVYGSIALIKPGTGSIALPDGVNAVVLDLRHLPAVDELKDVLPRMVAPAMASPVQWPVRAMRVHRGPVDEFYSPFNTYGTEVLFDEESPMGSSGNRDLPIVLIVGDRIAPQAAAFATALRAAGRAWILGQSVPLPVAETRWQGVGDFGLAVRTSTFVDITQSPPTILPNQLTYEDDNFDPTDLSYRRTFTVRPLTQRLTISVDAPPGNEALLVVLYDADGNGVFEGAPQWRELYGYVDGDGADEVLTLSSPPAGDYQVIVWAYSSPAGTMPFTLRFDESIGAPLPDEIQPDLPAHLLGNENDGDARRFDALQAAINGATPPPISGPADRTLPQTVNPFGQVHPKGESRGEVRAALIAVHGFVRHFFRYFDTVGDKIDDRLIETLSMADAHDGNRLGITYILRRFGEALSDGHQFVGNYYPVGFKGTLPVFLEHPALQVRPVVRRSLAPGIRPGDTIVALEGRPIEEVYAEELARTSAASLGYKYDLADRYIYRMFTPMTLTLEDPDGVRRTVTAPIPGPNDYFAAVLPAVTTRPNGPLTDLGAPNLYYFTLSGTTTSSTAQMRAAIAAAARPEITGMIVDVRGYLGGVDHYELALRLVDQPFYSPIFKRAFYTGPDKFTLDIKQFLLEPQSIGGPKFYGKPMVMLTGPHAVSASENFMQMMVGAGRLSAIVGQPSAATNGNITGLQLPGGFYFSYTGMEVRNPNGSQFHGVGIVPTIPVSYTARDVRDGVDRDLLEAIRLLR